MLFILNYHSDALWSLETSGGPFDLACEDTSVEEDIMACSSDHMDDTDDEDEQDTDLHRDYVEDDGDDSTAGTTRTRAVDRRPQVGDKVASLCCSIALKLYQHCFVIYIYICLLSIWICISHLCIEWIE